MALRDQPYIPLYVQDVLTDEKLIECSAATHGVYLRLICILHKQEKYGLLCLKQKYKQNGSKIFCFAQMLSKQMPFEAKIIEDAITELIDEGVLNIDDDNLFQKRMVRDGQLSSMRAEIGKTGGSSVTKQYGKKGFLYLMSDGESRHKIGVSVRPQNRLYRLRCDLRLPKHFGIIKTISVLDMGKAEDQAHEEYGSQMDGEWIKGGLDDILKIFVLLEAKLQANYIANCENENENENENTLSDTCITHDTIITSDTGITGDTGDGSATGVSLPIANAIEEGPQKKKFAAPGSFAQALGEPPDSKPYSPPTDSTPDSTPTPKSQKKGKPSPRALAKSPSSLENKLYTDMVGVYHNWLIKTTGIGCKMDGGEGAAMKKIRDYLTAEMRRHLEEYPQGTTPENKALELWEVILGNWGRLEPFLHNQRKLTQINSNLINILTQIRHGKQQGPATDEQINAAFDRKYGRIPRAEPDFDY